MRNNDRYDKQHRKEDVVRELGSLEYLDFNYGKGRTVSLDDELRGEGIVSVRSRVPASLSTNPEIATFLICAAVASSAYFFSGFLGEAGKDAYVWAKTKRALKDNKTIRFSYYFEIEELAFSDPAEVTEERHDQFLAAMVYIARKLPDEAFSQRLIVSLNFDSQKHAYTSAELLERIPGQANVPIQTFDLSEL